ncbi:carbon starvation protein A [soil metagenome]
MNILLPVIAAAVVLGIALRFYPRWIARVFREDDRNPVPSEEFADGRDFVKSRSQVVFGHHFATIAGAGPVVGPILALAFGWQPVWLWVVLGGIFFGAVHDMTSMFMSVREGGRSVARIAKDALGPIGYVLNLVVLIFVLTIVNAIFLNLSVTALTSSYPLAALGLEPGQRLLGTVEQNGVTMGRIGGIATTSVFVITAFAPLLGWLIRRRGFSMLTAYGVAGLVCLLSIVLGFIAPIALPGETWRLLMTFYVFVACSLPVWMVLQPRDFTNVQLLYGGMALLLISTLLVGLFHGSAVQAPGFDVATGERALNGTIWPILFITVACGAISGFHSLVASGTTVKQLPRESDVRRIGYGAMMLESFLAVLVLTVVASMLPQAEYLRVVYPEGAPSNPILAFALGVGRIVNLALPFLPVAVAAVIGILMIEGFVVTTLDSSVRLARYLLEEFWDYVFAGAAPALLRHPVCNTAIAVGMMLFFAVSGTVRQMWPIFGAGNQLIAALALTTVSVWLVQRARQNLFALLPAVFMICTTLTALVILLRHHFGSGNVALATTAAVLLCLSVGVVVIGATRFAQAVVRPGGAAVPAGGKV